MNTVFQGILFTGETLAAVPLSLEAGAGRLVSRTDGVDLNVALAEVRASDRLAGLTRFLYLPDGRTVETPDNAAIDSLLAGQKRGRAVAVVHWLEARARVAAVAALLVVASVGITIWWGLPVFACRAAQAVPTAIERQAGQSALLTLNRLLAPTQLDKAGKARVTGQLERLLKTRTWPTRPEIVFRSMGGKFPNAFALPGGFIVVSDELVALANDEELAAVLAHEIGHWQLRHGLQGVLRDSAALLVVSSVTGDLSTLTTFAGTIPFVLLQRGYSREFEEEADDYAIVLLRLAHINPVHLATILKKLEDARPTQGQDLTYLSTHPATADRIHRINPTGAVLPEPVRPRLTSRKTIPAPPAKAPRATPVNIGTPGVQPPQPLSQPQPAYPFMMSAAGLEGRVTVEFVINDTGGVENPRIIRSDYKEFEAPAVDAVMQWRFTPARLGGRNVPIQVSQLIEFRLDDAASASAAGGGAAPKPVSRVKP